MVVDSGSEPQKLSLSLSPTSIPPRSKQKAFQDASPADLPNSSSSDGDSLPKKPQKDSKLADVLFGSVRFHGFRRFFFSRDFLCIILLFPVLE